MAESTSGASSQCEVDIVDAVVNDVASEYGYCKSLTGSEVESSFLGSEISDLSLSDFPDTESGSHLLAAVEEGEVASIPPDSLPGSSSSQAGNENNESQCTPDASRSNLESSQTEKSPIFVSKPARKRKCHKAWTVRAKKKRVQGSSEPGDERKNEDVASRSLEHKNKDDNQDMDVDIEGLQNTVTFETLPEPNTEQEQDRAIGDPESASIEQPALDFILHSSDQELNGTQDAIRASIVANLKVKLPSHIHVSKEGASIRLVLLNKRPNADVERSLYYDNGAVRLYVHHFLLPRDHPIYHEVTPPVKFNGESLSEYLVSLILKLETRKICKGVSSHEELWKESKGLHDLTITEDSDLQGCFRHEHCHLILSGEVTRCHNCTEQMKAFIKKTKRAKERDKKNLRNIPNKYLKGEEVKEKLQTLAQDRKHDKRAVKRLQERLDKKSKQLIELDETLHGALLKTLKQREADMTPLQQEFWRAQQKSLTLKNKKSMKWHPMMIRIAIRLRSLMSYKGYEELRGLGVALPSNRRLYDYTHVIQAKEGCQEEVLKEMKATIDKSSDPNNKEHSQFINLMFDEMNVRSGLVLRRSTGELIGYTNLTEVEEELKKLNQSMASGSYEPPLAKKVLVYYAQGITSPVSNVVAVYSTDDLSASQLFTRTWEVMYKLEETAIGVLSLTCDGAAVNRKFINMHKPYKDSEFLFATKNLAAGEDRPIFFFLDPPHLVKTTRNCYANSFSHKKSRNLWKNGQHLSWKAVEGVYEATKNQTLKSHKITKAHVKLTSFSRMKVSYAVQVLSRSMADTYKKLKNHEKLRDQDLDEVITFTEKTNRFFDCMNGQEDEGKEPKNADLKAYRNPNDERFDFLTNDFLKYFKDWTEDVSKRPGCSKKEKARMTISYQTLQALKITVHSLIGAVRFMLEKGAPLVNARVFNQDRLEQYFSTMRRVGGGDDHPHVEQFLRSTVSQHVQGSVARGMSKGNTQVQRGTVELDDTALPALKRKRKDS